MERNVTLPEVKAFRLEVNYFPLGYSLGLIFYRQALSIGQ